MIPGITNSIRVGISVVSIHLSTTNSAMLKYREAKAIFVHFYAEAFYVGRIKICSEIIFVGRFVHD